MGLFLLFLILTGLSIAALVVGFVAFMATRGRFTTRHGREAGAAVMNSPGEAPPGAAQGTLAGKERSVFVGIGAQVQGEAESSFAEVKLALRERRWRDALPALLIFAGMVGLLVFGSLALWAGTGYETWSLLVAAVALFAAGRLAWDFVKG